MKRLLTFSAAIVVVSQISTTPVWAVSCTAHYQACMNNEAQMGKNAAARCGPNLKKCLAACKAGKPAVFIGPSTGRAFPASECN